MDRTNRMECVWVLGSIEWNTYLDGKHAYQIWISIWKRRVKNTDSSSVKEMDRCDKHKDSCVDQCEMSHNNIQGMEKKLRQIDPNLKPSESDWAVDKQNIKELHWAANLFKVENTPDRYYKYRTRLHISDWQHEWMSMSKISYPYAVDHEAGPSRKHSPNNVTFFDNWEKHKDH